MSTPSRLSESEHRELATRRMKRVATGLLICMGLLYLWARQLQDTHVWSGFVRAFAEAGMIGALADWFAVTALFRHPMGIPIPHTAVIPRRQERIARSIGDFVVDNFLHPEVLRRKLGQADLGLHLSRWLSQESHQKWLVLQISQWVPHFLSRVQESEVQAFWRKHVTSPLGEQAVAPWAAKVLEALMQAQAHQTLLEEGLKTADAWLGENKDLLEKKVAEQLMLLRIPVVGEVLAGVIAESLRRRIRGEVENILQDPEHEVRVRFHRSVVRWQEQCQQDPETQDRLEKIKFQALNSAIAQEVAPFVWQQLMLTLEAGLSEENADLHQALTRALGRLGEDIADDHQLHSRLSETISAWIIEEIAPRRQSIALFLEETARRWPAEEMTEKLERQVGRDLQFIRINGTLVGGLVGLILHTIFG